MAKKVVGTEFFVKKIVSMLDNTSTSKLKRICNLFRIKCAGLSDKQMKEAIANKLVNCNSALLKLLGVKAIEIMR